MYEHFYPMTCPTCRAWLTEPDSLDVCFAVAGQTIWTSSNLTENGRLQDVDRMIERGYHSDTSCRSCGESLGEHEVLPIEEFS